MSDYDLPAEYRIAIRKAKKRTSTGGVIILLSIFFPLLIEVGFLKRHHREIESSDVAPIEVISPKLLMIAGIAGIAFGLGVIVVGFIEEARAQKRIDQWRRAATGAKR